MPNLFSYRLRLIRDNAEFWQWLIEVDWQVVYDALDYSSDDGMYDGSRDHDLLQLLLASGAPAWVKDPLETYYDEICWIVCSDFVTEDELTLWAMFNRDEGFTGPTDDLQAVFLRYTAWQEGGLAKQPALPL